MLSKAQSPQVPSYWITKHLDFYLCFSREGLPLQDMQDSAELHRTVPSSCQRLQTQEPVSNHTLKFTGLQQELGASESEQSQVFLGLKGILAVFFLVSRSSISQQKYPLCEFSCQLLPSL